MWFMRQAGRYMSEYREIRKHHSLVEICKKPALAAEVTITAAEALGVDAAIIFADLLLPLEVMGLPFQFTAGEGPVIERPIREAADIRALRTDRAKDLMYVSEAVAQVAKHFGERLPVIGFCGAPFTLASYMVEGGGSRNYVEVKKLMYRSPGLWDEMLGKLVDVLAEYAADQVRHGADVLQVFDSWVGCLSVDDYRRYALPRTTELIHRLQAAGAPVIYFGTDTCRPAALHAGNRGGGYWDRLANSARPGLAKHGIPAGGAGESRSGNIVRGLGGVAAAGRGHPEPGKRTPGTYL